MTVNVRLLRFPCRRTLVPVYFEKTSGSSAGTFDRMCSVRVCGSTAWQNQKSSVFCLNSPALHEHFSHDSRDLIWVTSSWSECRERWWTIKTRSRQRPQRIWCLYFKWSGPLCGCCWVTVIVQTQKQKLPFQRHLSANGGMWLSPLSWKNKSWRKVVICNFVLP